MMQDKEPRQLKHGVYQGEEMRRLKGKTCLYCLIQHGQAEVQFDDINLPEAFGWRRVLASGIVEDKKEES